MIAYLQDAAHSPEKGSSLPLPFLYVRHQLAEIWSCRPGEIDEIRDADEIGLFFEVADLKNKYGKKRNRREDGEADGRIELDPE